MATVRWHLDELTGQTLTLRLYPLTSGTIANTGGDALTEAGDGLFSATVGESLTGWHKAYADIGANVRASGFVDMSGASPVVNEAVVESVSEDDIDEITAGILSGLGSLNVAVVSPIDRSGRLEIAAGDDYLDDSGQPLEFTITGSIPSLAGATIALTIRHKDYPTDPVIVGTGSLTSQVGETAVIKVEIPSEETIKGRTRAGTNWWYDLEATLANGKIRTLKGPQAPCTVLLDQTQ